MGVWHLHPTIELRLTLRVASIECRYTGTWVISRSFKVSIFSDFATAEVLVFMTFLFLIPSIKPRASYRTKYPASEKRRRSITEMFVANRPISTPNCPMKCHRKRGMSIAL